VLSKNTTKKALILTVTYVWLLTGNSRPTTPVESDNNNSGTETVGPNSVADGAQNGIDSYTGYNSLPAQHDIDNALASIGNQVISPASTSVGANTTKTDSSSVIKKKNKRSKHTKSCEIDYEELEKALAIAAANAVVPAGSRVDQMGVSTGSAKKKGHRRVKSGSGPKVDLDPGIDLVIITQFHKIPIAGASLTVVVKSVNFPLIITQWPWPRVELTPVSTRRQRTNHEATTLLCLSSYYKTES